MPDFYPTDMRSRFLDELSKTFPKNQHSVKAVISCRSHHFETLRQMNSFLLGLNRSGLRSSDYHALHLLPFSGEQMLALLTKLLGAEEAKQIFAFIDSEKYLKDLAQRPFLLRQLSSLLPKLREQKERGEPLNAAAFYQALIEDCLSRDDEKNLIKPRHKKQLLADLAAEFWQNSIQLWQIDQLNDWFCAWLNKQPELAAQYSKVDGHLLERDLRNSTLLVRFGEENFGFSHSSMQEFFLSRWLLRQWQEDENFYMEKPVSELTCQFIFDHLDSLLKINSKKINHFFVAILSGPWSKVSDYVLKIITIQAKQGLAVPELSKIDLRRANLKNKKIQGLCGKTLLLHMAEAYETEWFACSFQRIEIGQGDISGSLWQEFIHVGAVREPPLQNDVTLANCHGNIKLSQAHILPSATQMTESFFLKDWQLDISSFVISCCFNQDETRILSAPSDKTLKLWDEQGRCLQTLQCHAGKVLGCCFSPDGTRILSASDDKTLKLWDVQGRCFQTFQGHTGGVLSCCFSPDGSRILSASWDNTLKLWDAAGRCLQTLQGHEDTVLSCCFSPDGERILSSSDDGTLRLWNLDGTVERIFAAWEEQWYTAFFRNNQLEKIIGTEMSWKMAHFAKDGKIWTLDETGCFEWVPAQY